MRSGGTPPKSDPALWSGDVPWVSGKDLKKSRLSDPIDHITLEAAETYSKIAPAGSVLVLVRGMGLVNGLALSLIEQPMAFNQDLKALVPKKEISGAFLMYAMTFAGPRMLQNVADAAHGTKRLGQDDLDSFQIPVPPPKEQEDIVRSLDHTQIYTDVERRALDLTIDLKLATMREVFTRGSRGDAKSDAEASLLPAGWSMSTLGKLGRVGNGSTPKKTNPAYWTGGTYPWLTSAKVYEREITSADQFVTPEALKDCHLPRLLSGAVLMAITGQGKTLGHCAVLRTEATISQHLAYVAVDPTVTDPSYVRGYLETKYDYLRRIASGGGSTKGALTCAFLRDLPIPMPATLAEQREVVAILDTLDRKIALRRRKLAASEELFGALLHHLMTGEIRVEDLDLSVLMSSALPQQASV